MDRSDFPENLSLFVDQRSILDHQVWSEGGLIMSAIMDDMNPKDRNYLYKIPVGYNGYVRFPQEVIGVVHEIKDSIPARGGITYAEVSADGSAVYGFDTKHLHDEGDPAISDLEFIKGEIRYMTRMIALAIPFYAALMETGEFALWMSDWTDDQKQIMNAYDDQVKLLNDEATVKDPLPDDFWQRTSWHPSLRRKANGARA